MIAKFISIFDAINQILAVLAPYITVVFIWGVFWKRGTGQAAVISIITGFVLGALVFLLDFPAFGKVKIISEYLRIPYMLQSFLLFVIISMVYVISSLLTPKPEPEKIMDLTLDKPFDFITKEKISGWTAPRVLSVILILIVITLYVVFN